MEAFWKFQSAASKAIVVVMCCEERMSTEDISDRFSIQVLQEELRREILCEVFNTHFPKIFVF